MGRIRDLAISRASTHEAPPSPAATEDPQIGSSRIGKSGTIRGAIITGICTLLVGAGSYITGITVAEQTNDAAAIARIEQRAYEQAEERESMVCGDVYLRVRSKAAEDPAGVTTLYNDGLQQTLFSDEERAYCPAYPQVLEQARPKR